MPHNCHAKHDTVNACMSLDMNIPLQGGKQDGPGRVPSTATAAQQTKPAKGFRQASDHRNRGSRNVTRDG